MRLGNGRRTFGNHIKRIAYLFLLLFTGSLLACSQSVEPDKDEESYVFKVDENTVEEPEVMVYIYQVMNDFEEVGGEGVWEFEDFSGGKSAVEVAKDAVIDNIVRIKVLQDKANEMTIALTEDEVSDTLSEADNYYATMDDAYKDKYQIDDTQMHHVFKEYAIAGKVLATITEDFVPNDEDIQGEMEKNQEYMNIRAYDPELLLTDMTYERFYLTKIQEGSEDSPVLLDDTVIHDKRERAYDVLTRAQAGEDFSTMIAQEGDEAQVTFSFSEAMIPNEYESGIRYLEVGQYSDVIETDNGFHIFKLVGINRPTEDDLELFRSNFVNYENQLRATAIETLKKRAFDALYLEWKQNANVIINTERWNSIQMEELVEDYSMAYSQK